MIDWHRVGLLVADASIDFAVQALRNPLATERHKTDACFVGLLGFGAGLLFAALAPRPRFWRDRRGVIYRVTP